MHEWEIEKSEALAGQFADYVISGAIRTSDKDSELSVLSVADTSISAIAPIMFFAGCVGLLAPSNSMTISDIVHDLGGAASSLVVDPLATIVDICSALPSTWVALIGLGLYVLQAVLPSRIWRRKLVEARLQAALNSQEVSTLLNSLIPLLSAMRKASILRPLWLLVITATFAFAAASLSTWHLVRSGPPSLLFSPDTVFQLA